MFMFLSVFACTQLPEDVETVCECCDDGLDGDGNGNGNGNGDGIMLRHLICTGIGIGDCRRRRRRRWFCCKGCPVWRVIGFFSCAGSDDGGATMGKGRALGEGVGVLGEK